ncbi:hypothetical protein [Burkholderia pseudomallei]|uniref:Uncharacterized protein n=1 Tax=Ralstonia solanacearum TaxID=305 RepID=A0A0S4WU69_RALSL|nr:hypothetical protein [Burkholderia pseudomallei]CUV55122.1 protein of unknown function [Ralstonia solanacearum]
MSDLQWSATVIAVANHCSVAGSNGAIIATGIDALLLPMAAMLQSSTD